MVYVDGAQRASQSSYRTGQVSTTFGAKLIQVDVKCEFPDLHVLGFQPRPHVSSTHREPDFDTSPWHFSHKAEQSSPIIDAVAASFRKE